MYGKPRNTQYSEWVFAQIGKLGEAHSGTQFNVHQLADALGVKVTPSFRKRIKEAVGRGLLWDVAPHWKNDPRASEYRFPAEVSQELPF